MADDVLTAELPPISPLEMLCRDIATSLFGDEKSESGERGFDWKSVVEILAPIVISLLTNCPQSRSGLMSAIRRPSLRQRSYVKMVCRDHCRGANRPKLRDLWGAISDELFIAGERLDDVTLAKIVDEALSPESYLGV